MIKVSELQAKDVVNIGDGRRLGMVADLDIDLDNGMVRAIVVPGSGRFFGLFGATPDYVIPWNQIVKIGTDVVLVELAPNASYIDSPAGGSYNGSSSRNGGNSGGY